MHVEKRMSSELNLVWKDQVEDDVPHTVSAKVAPVSMDNEGKGVLEKAILNELIEHRALSQKRNMICMMSSFVLCALILNHIDRLHSRIRNLETLLSSRM